MGMISQILMFIFFNYYVLLILGMISEILGFIFFKKILCTSDIGHDQPDIGVYFL
jgi:hypothetical protein